MPGKVEDPPVAGEAPEYCKKAGIDPYNKLIDRTPEDNVMAAVRR